MDDLFLSLSCNHGWTRAGLAELSGLLGYDLILGLLSLLGYDLILGLLGLLYWFGYAICLGFRFKLYRSHSVISLLQKIFILVVLLLSIGLTIILLSIWASWLGWFVVIL
jgi:hypothetical protein